MILVVDVAYSEEDAVAAGVLFRDWRDDAPVREVVSHHPHPASYQPGEFYKRELPCILKLITDHALQPDCIIVDGFVYLDGCHQPGLGKRLYDALGGEVAVIGVAKSPFKGIGPEFAIYRGESVKPLFVTAAGIDLEQAKAYVLGMHGGYRVPSLLKRADQLSKKFTE
ncbi:MAG TPA: endonuclease V [Geomonas sp.]|nr:endonuclease V [Geomonas sp.]